VIDILTNPGVPTISRLESLGRDQCGYGGRPRRGAIMTTAPDDPLSTPEQPDTEPQEAPQVSEPDVEGDPDLVAPDPVEDA